MLTPREAALLPYLGVCSIVMSALLSVTHDLYPCSETSSKCKGSGAPDGTFQLGTGVLVILLEG